VFVEEQPAGAFGVGDPSGDELERMVMVLAVRSVGQQVLVFAVGDEQQPEQDHQRLFVGRGEIVLARVVGVQVPGDRDGQLGDGLEVHPVPQPGSELGGEVVRLFDDLFQGSAGSERVSAEQQT